MTQIVSQITQIKNVYLRYLLLDQRHLREPFTHDNNTKQKR
jgi:hypothetical protein